MGLRPPANISSNASDMLFASFLFRGMAQAYFEKTSMTVEGSSGLHLVRKNERCRRDRPATNNRCLGTKFFDEESGV